jgi:hypothetical protein
MHATQVSEDQAKALAQKYVDEQLKGFTIAPHQPARPRHAGALLPQWGH